MSDEDDMSTNLPDKRFLIAEFLPHVQRQRSVSTPDLDVSRSNRRITSSCVALRDALLTLYRLDDFIQEPLGNGFFSDVFKVTHKITGEVMVLKMNTIAGNRPNVLREVQLMNKMCHPNILKFLGVCVHEGQLSALTEYINGGNLHDLICDKMEDLTWLERVNLSLDISTGMNYLHSKGVFHRDLTSSNILIRRDGNSKAAVIGDFGLATKIPDKHNTETRLSIVGSPYWMSPECIHGKRYDEISDVFSFGIILSEMIARIDADPDVMPRTENFGLDYVAFSDLSGDCPLHLLYLAFRCCQMDPNKRPPFSEIITLLNVIKSSKLPQFNPIAARSPILAGHVRRNIKKFSNKDTIHKRSRSAGQSLEFLTVVDDSVVTIATPQCIGEHMKKEDEYYTPYSGDTNPFDSVDCLRGGKKIISGSTENLLSDGGPVNLPNIYRHYATGTQPSGKLYMSLPGDLHQARKALKMFSHEIAESKRTKDANLYNSVSLVENSSTPDSVRSHNKQLNRECAMLFSGLDLISINRFKSHNKEDEALETQFQDNLEDVLMSCSSSDSWVSEDHFSRNYPWDGGEYDKMSKVYMNKTLIEKKRQLRHVEGRAKIEQLQIQLDRLRKDNLKK